MLVNYQVESNLKPVKFKIENVLDGKCDIVLNDDIKEENRTYFDENLKKNIPIVVAKIIYAPNNHKLDNFIEIDDVESEAQ